MPVTCKILYLCHLRQTQQQALQPSGQWDHNVKATSPPPPRCCVRGAHPTLKIPQGGPRAKCDIWVCARPRGLMGASVSQHLLSDRLGKTVASILKHGNLATGLLASLPVLCSSNLWVLGRNCQSQKCPPRLNKCWDHVTFLLTHCSPSPSPLTFTGRSKLSLLQGSLPTVLHTQDSFVSTRHPSPVFWTATNRQYTAFKVSSSVVHANGMGGC